MRVLIADDSAFMRRMLTKLFESGRGFEVVGTARNGADAVAKCADLDPDVVTMDVEMPEMDGLEALRRIRAAHGPLRPAVLMCSTLTESGSRTALEAMRLGASDVIAKEHLGPGEDNTVFRGELLTKVRAIGANLKLAGRAVRPAESARPVLRSRDTIIPERLDLVVIGSSTGGPPVLERIIESLEAANSKPILIAQHMPGVFTRSMASRLDTMSPSRVVLASDGQEAEAGHVYVAEGGKHLRVHRRRGRFVLEVSPEPADALYKPSVNELFASAAEAAGSRCLGLVLTGMGDDGLEGARALAGKGAPIAAQSAETCVVYGMPRAVTEAGLVCQSVSPEEAGRLVARAAGCGGGGEAIRVPA